MNYMMIKLIMKQIQYILTNRNAIYIEIPIYCLEFS